MLLLSGHLKRHGDFCAVFVWAGARMRMRCCVIALVRRTARLLPSDAVPATLLMPCIRKRDLLERVSTQRGSLLYIAVSQSCGPCACTRLHPDLATVIR
jgi:hypothetical protein